MCNKWKLDGTGTCEKSARINSGQGRMSTKSGCSLSLHSDFRWPTVGVQRVEVGWCMRVWTRPRFQLAFGSYLARRGETSDKAFLTGRAAARVGSVSAGEMVML